MHVLISVQADETKHEGAETVLTFCMLSCLAVCFVCLSCEMEVRSYCFVLGRSPFYSHLSASINGLLSIRAFKAEDRFVEMYMYYQDFHTSAWFLFLTTSRWLGSRLDFICCVFISVVAMTTLVLTEAGVCK